MITSFVVDPTGAASEKGCPIVECPWRDSEAVDVTCVVQH